MAYMQNIEGILQACRRISDKTNEKSKEEINPLLTRIQFLLKDLETHLPRAVSQKHDVKSMEYHWGIVYNAADMLDEMATLIKNTTQVLIETEVEYIKQGLVFLTDEVIRLFGKNESKYIITPKFQELANMFE